MIDTYARRMAKRHALRHIFRGADEIRNPLNPLAIPGLPASRITSGQLLITRMPRGTDGYVFTGKGPLIDPVYEKLSVEMDELAVEVYILIAGALQRSGGTMTGDLTLAGAPSEDLHAATKKYVDDVAALLVPYTGATANVDLGEFDLKASNLYAVAGGFWGYNLAGFAFYSDEGITQVGEILPTNIAGKYAFAGSLGTGIYGLLDFSLITDTDRTFTFPDASGTFALLADLANYLPLAGGTITGNLAVDGYAWIKGRNYLFANPADPATPAYGMYSFLMMGLGSVLSFTPKFSGKLKIEVSMGCRHSSLNATVVQLAYGTGAPPANQAAATGTVFGPDLIRMTWADVVQVPTVASDATWKWVLEGLEVDTPYWFDAQVKQIGTGDGKASIHDIMVYIEEI